MRTYLLCLFCALLASPALAQTPDTATTAYKHELVLTAAPQLDQFFKANRTLPVGLLYRRQLTPSTALRLRLVGHYSRRDTVDYPLQRPGNFVGLDRGSNTQRWGLAAFAGYEWRHVLTKRLHGYYGAELGTGQTAEKVRTVGYTINQFGSLFQDGTYTTRRTQVQLRGFAGLHWQVASRLAVFAESATAAAYEWRIYKLRAFSSQQYNNNPGAPTEGYGYADFRGRQLSFSWRPVQLIGLSIRF